MAEEMDERSGLDRRELIKRGAVLGGALVWTVPAVQSIGGTAFAAGSPVNGVCPEGSTLYRFKFNYDATTNTYTPDGGTSLPDCPTPAGPCPPTLGCGGRGAVLCSQR